MLCFSFPLENWRINQLHFGSAGFHFLTNPKGFLWSGVNDLTLCFLLFFWRVLIGSPLSGQPARRTGDVYRCPVGQNKNTGCEKFNLSGERCPSCKHLCARLVILCFPLTIFVHFCVQSVCIQCVYCGYLRKPVTESGNRHYLSCTEIVIVSKLVLCCMTQTLHDSRLLVDFRWEVCHAQTWHFGTWMCNGVCKVLQIWKRGCKIIYPLLQFSK